LFIEDDGENFDSRRAQIFDGYVRRPATGGCCFYHQHCSVGKSSQGSCLRIMGHGRRIGNDKIKGLAQV
jgi:hypothetical protein